MRCFNVCSFVDFCSKNREWQIGNLYLWRSEKLIVRCLLSWQNTMFPMALIVSRLLPIARRIADIQTATRNGLLGVTIVHTHVFFQSVNQGNPKICGVQPPTNTRNPKRTVPTEKYFHPGTQWILIVSCPLETFRQHSSHTQCLN